MFIRMLIYAYSFLLIFMLIYAYLFLLIFMLIYAYLFLLIFMIIYAYLFAFDRCDQFTIFFRVLLWLLLRLAPLEVIEDTMN